MKNKKILIIALLMGLSSHCLAEPISIAEIKKQRESAITQQGKQIQEDNLKHGYFSLKNNSYFNLVEGKKDYDFLTITTEIEFKNYFGLYCKNKTDERCLKVSDFKDFQQAIDITRKFYKKLEETRAENDAVTIFSDKIKQKPENFLKYWKKTSNAVYIQSTIYYKKELGENYIYANFVNILTEQIKAETRVYIDELADLLKDSSKRRLLGLDNKYPYTYITDIVNYIN